MPFRAVDLTRVRTYPLPQRQNRVALENLVRPEEPAPLFDSPDLDEVAGRIAAARQAGRPVIFMIGAHVIKRGLAPLLIDLLERGVITHLASNGAATIHDFEIAMQGSTSEDVASALEHGSFGMAEETGRLMNQAIRAGARDGLGAGEALGRMIASGEPFAFRQHSLLYAAYRLKIPYTVHIALGTDIIHQHPAVDFAATGWASGQDFKIFTASVCELEGGVFCNFGSAVLGPEVFLKALSIARNLAESGLSRPVRVFTTANFDLIPLGDYRRPVQDDVPDYYYRPRKNIVNRPVLLGGKGFHICGDHLQTIPNLHHKTLARLQGFKPVPVAQETEALTDPYQRIANAYPAAAPTLRAMAARYPELAPCVPDLARAFETLLRTFRGGGTLFICGNGGSMADALHIAAELDKSFRRPRALPDELRKRLLDQPGGDALAGALQQGLRTVPLGTNPSLSSAVANDNALRDVSFAQELYALARPGDILLGISTSGNAQNVRFAASTAHALEMPFILLTGPTGGALASQADIAIRAPGSETSEIQSWHILLYHALCEMLEATVFDEQN
ncbi:MAG TPA: SIS domain-containing protein [Anaerolineaceae bacterium]